MIEFLVSTKEFLYLQQKNGIQYHITTSFKKMKPPFLKRKIGRPFSENSMASDDTQKKLRVKRSMIFDY